MNVFDISYLQSATRKSDLLAKLNDLHKQLSTLSQDVEELPKGLKQVASHLVSKRMIGHADKDVRLMTSCCLVDIFRVYAPEAPFGDEEMVSVFEVIIGQLRSLSTHDIQSTIGQKTLYILSSISNYKSCVVPVILAQSGVAGASDLVTSLFEALVSSIRVEHTDEVLMLMASVLQACIEETDNLDQELIDILLNPLIPSNKIENPVSYKLVSTVLRKTTNNIQIPISNFINHVLVGSGNNGDINSDLAEHIYSLIYELHKISPELLLRMLPNICIQLQAEEEDIRLKAVKLLGRLFSSQYADYGVEFNRNFKDFLNRFVDISQLIRLEMIECAAIIMKNKPNLISLVEEPLSKRIKDNDHDVRSLALQKLLEVSLIDVRCLNKQTYFEMCERVKDRKLEIRKIAIQGLAKLYYRNISSTLPLLESLYESTMEISNVINVDIFERLKLVPSYIIKCWNIPETKHNIITIIQEYLIPKAEINLTENKSETGQQMNDSDDNDDSNIKLDKNNKSNNINSIRATALLLLYSLLDSDDKKSLGSILSIKTRIRNELKNFLNARDNAIINSKTTTNSTNPIDKNLTYSMHRLLQVLPPIDKKTSLLEKLHNMKDKKIFRLLNNSIAADDNIQESCHNREDLKQRVESKSVLGEYIETLYDMSGYMVVNKGMCECILKYILSMSSNNEYNPNEFTNISGLLTVLAKHTTSVFSNSAALMNEWLDVCCDEIKSTSTITTSKSKRGGKSNSSNNALTIESLKICLYITNTSASVFEYDDENINLSLCNSLLKHAQSILDNNKLAEHLSESALNVSLFSSKDDNNKRRLTNTSKSSSSTIDSPISKLIHKLSSSKELNLSNTNITNNIWILSALVKIPSTTQISSVLKKTNSNLDKEFLLIKKESLDRLISFISNDIVNHKDIDVHLAIGTMKLWTNLLTSIEEINQKKKNFEINSSEDNDKKENMITKNEELDDEDIAFEHGVLSNELNDLIVNLFNSIQSNGETIFNISANNKIERNNILETAACCVFHLIKIQSVGKNFSILQWQTLGWTLINTDNDITKRNILNSFNATIQTTVVHPRFLAYSCLLAGDENCALIAEQALMFAVKRWRCTYELTLTTADSEKNNKLRKLAEDNMPEHILPYVLHLLSYHPDFPISASLDTDADKKRMKTLVKCVKMILSVLLDSLANQADNLSFLLKQVQMISQYYQDRNDPDNVGLHFVARTTAKLLNERVKTAENIQNYPRDINLPMDLYIHRSDCKNGNNSNTISRDIGVIVPGLEDAEVAIDKALNGNKSRRGKGISSELSSFISGTPAKNQIKRKRNIKIDSSLDENDDIVTTSSKNKIVKKELPAEIPSRISSRSKSKPVTYIEPEESEKEVELWEKELAEKERIAKASAENRRLSSSSLSNRRLSKESKIENKLLDDKDINKENISAKKLADTGLKSKGLSNITKDTNIMSNKNNNNQDEKASKTLIKRKKFSDETIAIANDDKIIEKNTHNKRITRKV